MRKALSAGTLSPVILGSLVSGKNLTANMFPRSLPMPHGMVQLSDVKFNPDLSMVVEK